MGRVETTCWPERQAMTDLDLGRKVEIRTKVG
jgi:hypothetical protein